MFFEGLVRWPVNDGGPVTGFDVLQAALDGGSNTLLGKPRIFPAWVHEPILAPQPEAQPVSVADLPALVFHKHEEEPPPTT